jgi:hypothetical protein
MSNHPASPSEQTSSPIVELRQYTHHPGQRDVLIDLFESRFIETQERVGMQVIGQFRDLDYPNRFTWLRGFTDMPRRARSLADFYDGPVWQSNRDAANATLIDSDNVLLLRPARPDSGFALHGERPALGTEGRDDRGIVEATILHLEASAVGDAVAFLERDIAPAVAISGACLLGYFVTEPSPNTFPRLPVREGEHVLVWFAGFPDRSAHRRAPGDRAVIAARAEGLKGRPEVLRLAPTSRSLLTGASMQPITTI